MSKTTWTARTKTQLVAALTRKGFNRASVRETCDRAYSRGFGMAADDTTELVVLVTYGDTEVDAWDAEILPYDEGMDKGMAIVRARRENIAAHAEEVAKPAGRDTSDRCAVCNREAHRPGLRNGNHGHDYVAPIDRSRTKQAGDVTRVYFTAAEASDPQASPIGAYRLRPGTGWVTYNVDASSLGVFGTDAEAFARITANEGAWGYREIPYCRDCEDRSHRPGQHRNGHAFYAR